MNSIIKKPSAWLPIVMSLFVIGMLAFYLTTYGVVHEEDEGIAAHLFQTLMGGQIPIIAFFALKWLPRSPRPALVILALQIFAALVAMAPVFYFQL